MRTFVAILILLLGAALPGRADIIYFDDGTTLEGEAVDEGDVIRVRMGGASITVDRARVVRIEKKKTPLQIYREKAGAVANTADARVELARWCKSRRLSRQMREQLGAALEIDPDHAAARKLLGHVRVGDKWMSADQARLAAGWKKLDGRWRNPQEVARREAVREAIAVRKAREEEIIALARKMGSADKTAAAAALKQILARGEAAITGLQQVVRRARSAAVRVRAAEALAQIPRPRSAALFRTTGTALANACIYDRDRGVRTAAAQAVRRTGNIHAFGALLQHALGSERAKRTRAALALKVIDHPWPLAQLVNNIREPIQYGTVSAGRMRTVTGSFGGGVTGTIQLPTTTVTGVGIGTDSPAAEALKTITGEDFGTDKAKWIAWLKRHFTGQGAAPAGKNDQKKNSLRQLFGYPAPPGP